MKARWRHAWLKAHRWIALSLGLPLLLSGLLGSVLVIAKPLDRWANAHLFHADPGISAQAPARLETIRRRLDREFGAHADYTFRPAREPGDTVWVYVRGPWAGTVFFDSAGRERGRRGEFDGAYNALFELHSALLLGDTGRALLATGAAAYLLLLVTGLALWWPKRWRGSLRMHWRLGFWRAAFDFHRTAGVLAAVLIAVSVASGAYMAWPPLRAGVSALAGQPAVRPPKPTAASAAEPRSLDELVATARALYPAGTVGYVQVPQAMKAVRVRLKLPDDPHPNGLTSVWLDPASAEVLGNVHWSQLDPGNRWVSTVYPLHTGALGGGWHAALVAITGLVLFATALAGVMLWCRRTGLRPFARVRARRAANRPRQREEFRSSEIRENS
jgi:uncharacterized iron-regulated membrane protein